MLYLEQFPPVKTFDLDEGFNTEIKYSLGGSTSSWFAIDPVSGIITVSAEGSSQLDRETTATVVLQVGVLLAYLKLC